MHLFSEPVWKLHIGEIPEKPHEFIDEIEQYDIWEEYRNEIAVIKQNALTVDNEEIIGDVIDKLRITNHCGTDFYKWIGSCFKTDICSKGDRCTGSDLTCEGHPIWVAILTLPEEKKNTMENMTKEQELTEAEKFLIKKSQECPTFTNDGLNQLPYILVPAVAKCMEEFIKFSLHKDHPTTASGSVAAPKEEGQPYFHLSKNEYGKMWLMYKPDGEGRYKCWEPITEEFWNEFEKLLR